LNLKLVKGVKIFYHFFKIFPYKNALFCPTLLPAFFSCPFEILAEALTNKLLHFIEALFFQGLNVVVCQDDNSPDPDDILTIGDRLYSKVHNLQPEYADKITGMLLECDNEKQISMLNNDAVLEEMVSLSVEVLADDDTASTDVSYSDSDEDDDEIKEQLGESLYEHVAELEPELCGQITGMLLELDEAVIRELLESRNSLEKAVVKARTEYLLHLAGTPTGSSSSEDDELSCEVYNLVVKKCPENADRITGEYYIPAN
jgi:uncharacterized protein (UPF0297 family)